MTITLSGYEYMKIIMRTAGWRITWKKIIAFIDATFAVAKRKPENIQACTRFEPLTSAIPVQRSTIELTSQLGAGHWIAQLVECCSSIAEVKGLNLVQAWIFSGFLFATAKVASINAMIFFHIILHPAVLLSYNNPFSKSFKLSITEWVKTSNKTTYSWTK